MNKHILILFALVIFSTTTFGDTSQKEVTKDSQVKTLAKDRSIQGIWVGTLKSFGVEVEIVFTISENSDNKFTATMDIPFQRAQEKPVDEVTFQNGNLRLEIKSMWATFEGCVKKNFSTVEGQWKQAGQSIPLVLRRVNEAPKLHRPQEPKKPYPYNEEEVTYENKKAGVKLAGTLTYPQSKGPFPAVLLVSGSGPQDRNETVFGHCPFLVLADHLTRYGFAVLRVDDRGMGGSGGSMATFFQSTSEDLMGDVMAGVEYLKSRKEINPKQIGLIGHSEGGIIAPMAAAKSPAVAFIVLMASPGLMGEEVLYSQNELLLRAVGASDEVLATRRASLKQIFDVLKNEKDNTTARIKIRKIARDELAKMSEKEKEAIGASESMLELQIQMVMSPWFRFFLTYNPKTTLMKVKCPVLAIIGEKDLQVSSKENLEAIEETLKAGGNKHYMIKELSNLNHLFQTAETGALTEYAKIEETISPTALKLIADWIKEALGQTKGPVVYTVTIPEENWRKAKVSCQMKPEDVLSLSMNNNGAPRVPDGYASFVHNLTVVDSEGNTLPIKNFGDARWKIQSKENQPLTLSYEVLLKHDKSDLPWGRDEAPYVTEDGVFWTGRALFIKGDMNDITVRFNLPEGWHVTTPWQPVLNQLPTFLLEDEQELTESFLFAGTHIEEQAKVGDTEIMLALGNGMQKSKDLIQEAVQKFLNEYEEVFGGSPKTRTLIVANRQDRKGSFDGGVFGRSISVLMGDEPTENNTQRWAPFIAHEVFHLWNGQIIEHSGQENWFSEGFTDYYATVICARTSMIDEHRFIERLRQACKQYFSKSGQIPIREAREYELQYAGGSLVAASLDIQIRKLTNNARSLDHLMQQMYLEFGDTSKKYDLEHVIRLVNNITGKDLTSFFEKYVSGTEELPLSDYFGYIGMDLKKEVTEELADLSYVVHKMLNIQSLKHSGLVIRRSHAAGYQDEDRLIAIAGTPVNNTKDMQTVAGSLKRGEKIQVGLLRDGKEVTLEITVGGDQQSPPLERKVEISLEKIASLNSSQKSIFSGITSVCRQQK